MTGLGLPELFRNRALGRGRGIRAGEMLPADLHVGRAEPARYLGPEARCAGGDPRKLRHDRDEDAGRHISSISRCCSPGRTSWAIVRSLSHDDFTHLSTAHRVTTGHVAPTQYSDAAGPSPNDWPHLGSLIARVRPRGGVLPQTVTMPWTVAHPAAPGGKAPGQHGGWLGKAYDPFGINGDPNDPDFRVEGLGLPEGITSDRLDGRRVLRTAMGSSPGFSGTGPAAWDGYCERALDSLGSAEAMGAFAIDREDTARPRSIRS